MFVSDIQAPDGRSPQYRYMYVAEDIASRIKSGELAPGARLLSERDLAAYYGVAFHTVRHAIEILRDPSHTRMLPGTELTSLVKGAGFEIESQTSWDKPREFEEWMGIVNDPARVPSLRAVVRALASAGVSAGIGLSLEGEKIKLFHRWNLIAARKPAGRGR